MTAVLLLLCLLPAVGVGVVQCVVHANLVRYVGTVSGRTKLVWLLVRAGVCLLFCWLLLGKWWWLAALGCMPITSAVFNYAMAQDLRDRRWHPLYVGISARYDRLLLWWSLGTVPPNTPYGHAEHNRRYHSEAMYRELVHHAGRTRYAIELGASLVLTIAYIITTL